jgi:hypothetical protein
VTGLAIPINLQQTVLQSRVETAAGVEVALNSSSIRLFQGPTSPCCIFLPSPVSFQDNETSDNNHRTADTQYVVKRLGSAYERNSKIKYITKPCMFE